MKIVLTILCIAIWLNAIEYKGDISLVYKKFDYSIHYVKNKEQKTILVNVELKKNFDDMVLFGRFESLADEKDNNRKYNKLNELYFKYESDDYEVKIGRDIKYWGALELYNITDIYNANNSINDKFDKNKKLGTIGFTYNYFLQNEDEITFIISEDIKDKSKNKTYIKYSGSRDDIASRDFTYIYNFEDEMFLLYHTVVVEDTIYKLEYIYENINTTYHIGAGIEQTFYKVYDKQDISLMVEYYKSDNINTTYQNNIFVGTRYTFNDTANSDITIGIIKNNSTNEYSKSVELKSRLYDKFNTKLSYISNDILSIYSINIGYYF
jgi:hypothetical protein